MKTIDRGGFVKKLLLISALVGCGAPNVDHPSSPQTKTRAGRFSGTMELHVNPATGSVDVVKRVATTGRGVHAPVTVEQDGTTGSGTAETFEVTTTSALIGDGINGCAVGENCFDVEVGSFRAVDDATAVTLVIDAVSPSRVLLNGDAAPPGSGLVSPYGMKVFGDIPAGTRSGSQQFRFFLPNEDYYVVVFSLWEEASSAPFVGQTFGPAAPPGTLGTFTMIPFAADPSPIGTVLSDLATPIGGNISFSNPVHHQVIGNGWSTWSHGYTGDVYPTYNTGSVTSLTITMPADTGAFYFYVESNPFSIFNFTAVAQDGTTVSQDIEGNAGAGGFGFFATTSADLVSVTVSSTVDFAVGEFGIAQNNL